jgi:hypothetical protein
MFRGRQHVGQCPTRFFVHGAEDVLETGFGNGFRFRVSSLTNVRLACLLVSKESNALEFRFTPRRAVSDHPASRTRAVHLGSCAALCPFIAASREGFWLFAPPLDLLCGFFFLMSPARPPHVLSLPATFASSSSLCAPLSLSAPSPPSLVSLPSALSPCSMLLAPSSLLLVEIKTYTSRKSAVYIHEGRPKCNTGRGRVRAGTLEVGTAVVNYC